MVNLSHLKVFLVGGAVRDELLGHPIKERDWVVVGSTPDELLALGFKSVGKDFPVFLHPETKEEYALARTERKTKPGYTGFEFHTEPSVTLEDDLARRDLTINAIAKDKDGLLIDPFNGQADLKNKTLRHVSPAFVEDPVRILRVARFSARFPDFTIAGETNKLMQHMINIGEVDALIPERIWQEFFKALNETSPQQFFNVLIKCHALENIFPELKNDNEAISALIKTSKETNETVVRFSALLHNVKSINVFCNKLRAPKEYKDIAHHTANLYKNLLSNKNITPEIILSALENNDAFRRPERFKRILLATKISLSLTNENKAVLVKDQLEKALDATASIDIENIINSDLTGKQIAQAIHTKRLDIIKELIR